MSGFDPFGTFRRSASGNAGGQPTTRRQPATGRSVPWHKRREWKRSGRQLFRFYSKRSDFTFVLKPGQKKPLAAVAPDRQRVEVTTAFPEAEGHADFRVGSFTGPQVRGAQMLTTRPTELWLRGLTAHEAGHILFSGEKPEEAALGWLWNALEDERMERLTARRYRSRGRLEAIFETMGDVMLTETDEERERRREAARDGERRLRDGFGAAPMNVLNSCLLWRWLHDHAPPKGHPSGGEGYHPYLPLPQERFEEARPLIEKAWAASTSARVTEIARELLALFDIPEDSEVPDGALEDFDLPGGAVPGGGPAAGSGSGDPSGEAGGGEDSGDESGDSGSDDHSESGDDSKGEDDPGDAGDGGSGEPNEDPELPDVDPQSALAENAADLLGGLEADARALAEALKPEAKNRTARTPSRSRGRFEYRRYAKGRERVFSKQPERAAPPAFITVLMDISGSMGSKTSEDDDTPLIRQAQCCVALLSGAAELAGTHLRVIPFTTQAAPPTSSRDVGHETLRLAVASACRQGQTRLAPALRAAFQNEPPAAKARGGRHIVALISDGELEARDARECQKVYREARRGSSANATVLPLLLGEATSEKQRSRRPDDPTPEEVYEAIFRRHAAIEDASELPAVAARWIKHAT